MNSIGVDFKLKNFDLDGTRFKLQIVLQFFIYQILINKIFKFNANVF